MPYSLLMNCRTGEFKFYDATTRDTIEIGDYIEGYFPAGREEKFEVADSLGLKPQTLYRRPFVLTLSALPGEYNCLFDYTPEMRETFMARHLKRHYIYAFVGRPATLDHPQQNVVFKYKKLEVVNVAQ